MIPKRQVLLGVGLGATAIASTYFLRGSNVDRPQFSLNRQSTSSSSNSSPSFLTWLKSFLPDTPKTGPSGNRIYLPVRFESELDTLIPLPRPLILNFTVRNDPACNKLTGALQRIVSLETDKVVSMVDIEVDEPGTKELRWRYSVTKVPTLVALKRGIIKGVYNDDKLDTQDVDWQALKEWVESVADDE